MACVANRSCVFPVVREGLCRQHLQDGEYPFSLPFISCMFMTVSYTGLLSGGGIKGFEVTDNVRFALSGIPHWRAPKTKAEIISNRFMRDIRKRDAEERRRLRAISFGERKAKREAELKENPPKWGVQVDACADLSIGQSVEFASNEDRFPNQFRAILSNSKKTMNFIFKIAKSAGGYLVIKTGQRKSLFEWRVS
jgi:hypothetical protein